MSSTATHSATYFVYTWFFYESHDSIAICAMSSTFLCCSSILVSQQIIYRWWQVIGLDMDTRALNKCTVSTTMKSRKLNIYLWGRVWATSKDGDDVRLHSLLALLVLLAVLSGILAPSSHSFSFHALVPYRSAHLRSMNRMRNITCGSWAAHRVTTTHAHTHQVNGKRRKTQFCPAQR